MEHNTTTSTKTRTRTRNHKKATKETNFPYIHENYPYYQMPIDNTQIEEAGRQTNRSNEKPKCPYLYYLDNWNYKGDYLIAATSILLLSLALTAPLVAWNLRTCL